MGKTTDEWTFGDVEAGFKKAALVLDETFMTPNTSHQTLETRTAMAYWQNGKLLHPLLDAERRCRRSVRCRAGLASRPEGRRPHQRVHRRRLRQQGDRHDHRSMIPALLSKKANAPVMMRIDREEEHFIGRARPAIHGRVKVGFAKDGRITALDMFTVNENGPYEPQGDDRHPPARTRLAALSAAKRCGGAASRCSPTRRRGARSAAGRHAGHRDRSSRSSAKAARKLGIDQVAIRKINAPAGKAKFGPAHARAASRRT